MPPQSIDTEIKASSDGTVDLPLQLLFYTWELEATD
jgi:hypothetical protein